MGRVATLVVRSVVKETREFLPVWWTITYFDHTVDSARYQIWRLIKPLFLLQSSLTAFQLHGYLTRMRATVSTMLLKI